jgi:hypothetical protein
MVLRGWDACGLLAPFKDELAGQCAAKACAAMCDTEHPLYPLFPNGDRAQPPCGTEPTPGPIEDGTADLILEDEERQRIEQHADVILASEPAVEAAKRPRPNQAASVKLFPIFAKRAKTGTS